jgi:hypothetical protein
VLVLGGVNEDWYWPHPGAELFDPATGQWSSVRTPPYSFKHHHALLLPDGSVLVAGQDIGETAASLMRYLPDANLWEPLSPPRPGGWLAVQALPDGRILMAQSGEAWLFDVRTRTFLSAGRLPRISDHTLAVLPNGRTLWLSSGRAAVWDVGGHFWETRSYAPGLWGHNSLRLAGGGVLVVTSEYLPSAEQDTVLTQVFDALTEEWVQRTPLGTARFGGPVRVALRDGRALLAGGLNRSGVGASLASAELYTPPRQCPVTCGPRWQPLAPMFVPRVMSTATRLNDGSVLVAGGIDRTPQSWGDPERYLSSTERFVPFSRTWELGGSLRTPRGYHVATRLQDGRVLVTGGQTRGADGKPELLASAELYDPVNRVWTRTASMAHARSGHTALLLPDGRVLVAGGMEYLDEPVPAELYEPWTETWTSLPSTPNLAGARLVALPGGAVLALGSLPRMNDEGDRFPSETHFYDVATKTWRPGPLMKANRWNPLALALRSGRVLAIAAGGYYLQARTPELFEPDTQRWVSTGPPVEFRMGAAGAVLSDGRALLTGGVWGDYPRPIYTGAELFDEATGHWTPTAVPREGRMDAVLVALDGGEALLAGGSGMRGTLASAELFVPNVCRGGPAAP